jgi:hypothetical protein
VAWHFTDLEFVNDHQPQAGPVHALGYELIIHVDLIIDYRPQSASSAD